MPSSKRPTKKKATRPQFEMDPELRRDILAVLLLAMAIVTAIAVFFPGGELGRVWGGWVNWLFGWGSLLVAAAAGIVAVVMLRQSLDSAPDARWQQFAGVGLLVASFLGILQLAAATGQASLKVADANEGGGHVGHLIADLLSRAIGPAAAFLVLLAVGVLGIVLALDITRRQVQDGVLAARQWAVTFYHLHLRPLPPSNRELEALSPPPTTTPEKPAPVAQPRPQPQPAASAPLPEGVTVAKSRHWTLPSLDLLEASVEQELSQVDIRRRVKIIEDTLQSFNIQARVVEVNQGPTVTQFGVQPAPGITVNRIVARSNDLALALAAAPIRIEAPVPGKSVVGIEVPNAVTALVGLRGVIETPGFQRVKTRSKLAIALGQDVSGAAVCADLTKMPHLLIAGATGSGKTVCLNSVIACFLFSTTPDEVKLLMVDPKMVELVGFNGIPHLIAPVVTDVDKVVNVLKWALREMERRYKLFSAAGARNIDSYNRLPAAKRGGESLPFIVLVIDELADVMMMAPEETERLVCRLAQMARATGIHLIIATQRPSVDVITGLIKANFPARISFAVTSQIDSRVVLDMAGAEKLLGRGDMLYMASDSSKTVRLQGTWVSDEELETLVSYWKDQSAGMSQAFPVTAAVPAAEATLQSQPDRTPAHGLAPWSDMADEAEDPLFAQAVEVVREAGRASVSLLQRKLRIGYARAARLIDLMEEEGVIGGPAEGGRAREVLDTEGVKAEPGDRPPH